MIHLDGEISPTSYVGTCEDCGAWTRLKAYDAKKIRKLGGLPLKRAGQVHVEARCNACGSGRVLDAAEWGALVARVKQDAATASTVEDPERAAAILVGLADIHDRETFLPVAHALNERLGHALDVQRALLFAYDRFDMPVAAERAAARIVELEDTPANRRALARVYLRQQKPDEALAQLAGQEHTPEGTGHLTLVAELFAVQGKAAEAHEVLARLDAADPVVAETRALVEQNLAGGPLLQVRYLPSPDERRAYETPRSAASPGCLWAVALVFIVPVALLLVVAALFATEKVEFVNGTTTPYVIEVDGEKRELPPGYTTLDLKAGEHEVRAFVGTEREFAFPVHVDDTGTYEKHFVNPDRAAILRYEEAEYRIVPTDKDHYKSHFMTGDLEYVLGADYFFQEFPPEVEMYGDSEIRSRITLWTPKQNLIFAVDQLLLEKDVGRVKAMDMLRARLLADPDDQAALDELVYRTVPEEMPALRSFLSARLDDVPARMAWHRAFLKTGFDARAEYLARPPSEDGCALGLRAALEPKVSEKEALFARATEGEACDTALHEAARFEARRGQLKKARALLARAKPQPSVRGVRDHAHLLVGEGAKVAAEREAVSEGEHRAIRIWVDLVEGRRRQGLRRAREFFGVLQQPDGVPVEVLNSYKAWAGFVSDIVGVVSADRAVLQERARADGDLQFGLDLVEGRLDKAAASLASGTPEAHLLVAAHALKRRNKRLAKVHVELAKARWGSDAAKILDARRPPKLADARAAGAELQIPRALFAYLGAKHKKRAKVFYKEADRLLTDVTWSSLAIRGLPYRWRQGRVR